MPLPAVAGRRLKASVAVCALALLVTLGGCSQLTDTGSAHLPAAAHKSPEVAPPGEQSDGASHNRSLGDPEASGETEASEHAPNDEPVDAAARSRPVWLGTRPLPLRDDGFGQILPTPDELVDRRLPPPSSQPRAEQAAFSATIVAAPAQVVERSTWGPHCPVDADDLALVEVTFWGFDGHVYRGELLTHRDAAQPLAQVFATLFDLRFPLEEVRIITPDDLDAASTGDGNVTTVFVCRAPVSGGGWSQHAYGTAIDLNPFHNPYVRADIVIPELASAYVDRDRLRPGMIVAGDEVTAAFASIGWGWGGNWRSAHDPMHFSATGR